MSFGDDDFEDARNTKCQKCGACYEAVRPGKIQPTCLCEYIGTLEAQRDSDASTIESLRARLGEAERERDQALKDAESYCADYQDLGSICAQESDRVDEAIGFTPTLPKTCDQTVAAVNALKADRDAYRARAEAAEGALRGIMCMTWHDDGTELREEAIQMQRIARAALGDGGGA